MKFLFILPRFHTNLIPWIQSLKNNNHKVNVFAIHKGLIEDYEIIKPQIFELSFISTILIRIIGTGGENFLRGFPKLIFFIRN